MFFTRKRFFAPAAVVLALTLTPMLTACSGNPLSDMLNKATGGQVDIGGTAIPKNFPSDVPLVSGSVISGSTLGTRDGAIWNVAITASDASAVEGIASQLEAAGFSTVGELPAAEEGSNTLFTKPSYGVLVIVSKDDGGAFIVNYTVTYTKAGS